MTKISVPRHCPMGGYCRKIANILNKNPLDLIDREVAAEMDVNLLEARQFRLKCKNDGEENSDICIWEQGDRLKGIEGNNARAFIWASLFLVQLEAESLTESGRASIRARAELDGGHQSFKRK